MRYETSLCTPSLVCICLFTFRESASVSLSFLKYKIRVFACSCHCGSCKKIDDCRLRRRKVRVNKCAWGVRWTGFSMIFSSRANRRTLHINFVRPLLNLSLKCHEGLRFLTFSTMLFCSLRNVEVVAAFGWLRATGCARMLYISAHGPAGTKS